MRIVLASSTIVAVVAALWLGYLSQNNRLVWDHFDVVKPGFLYRSGQLDPDQLEAAVKTYGIRTVVSFQVAGEGVENERAVAESLGVDFMNLPMSGDGAGREVQFREVLKAIDDPDLRSRPRALCAGDLPDGRVRGTVPSRTRRLDDRGRGRRDEATGVSRRLAARLRL